MQFNIYYICELIVTRVVFKRNQSVVEPIDI